MSESRLAEQKVNHYWVEADWNSAGPQIFGTESLSSATRPTPNASANAPDAGSVLDSTSHSG